MKKLLVLFALLGTCLAYSQTITPDTLLGEWNLRKISLMGNMADLKTGEITVSDAFAKEKGQTKEALAEQFKKRLPHLSGTLWFYTGNRMEYKLADKESTTGSYIITQENEKQYLTDEYSGTRIEMYFQDGLLYWHVLSGEGMVTMAWQRAAQ